MLKGRIQEVVEFTKSESPYKKANKGWIGQDIFLDLSPSADTYKQTNEDAKVILFWSPINSLLSNLFIIIFLSSIFVFTSISIAKGRFDFNIFNNYVINDIVNVDENEPLNIINLKDIDSKNLTSKRNFKTNDLDTSNPINSLDNALKKADKKIITEEIDEQDTSIKESESNKDIKILQNKKPKSNFI